MPNLRFPEFKEEWEKKNGNEIFKSISDKNHTSELPILAISQEYGAIPRDLIDYKITVTDKSISSYKVVRKGNFIISLRSFQGGIEYSEYHGICSPAYVILKSKIEISDYFFKYYLKTDRYILELNKKLEGIRDGKMISYSYFSEIKLPYPSLVEQCKIADFLTLIDERIQCQRKIINQLDTAMRIIREKIFKQQIKFRDKNGKHFPGWDMKTLGEIANIRSGLSKEQNSKSEGCKVTRIETISNGEINVNKVGFIDISDNIDEYKLRKGDILFSNINSVAHIGKTAIAFSDLDIYHGMNLLCIKSKSDVNPLFLFYYLNTIELRNYFKKICNQAVSQASINQSELSNTRLSLPCFAEQNQIANFLTSLDVKIETEKQLFEQYKQQKAYLLQNLFI